MISIEECTEQVKKEHIAYLKGTPVSSIADSLSQGLCQLKSAAISSLLELGEMQTIFADLGGIKSSTIFGQEKFLVKQVLDVLNNPDCTDAKSLESINYFMGELMLGSLDPIITIYMSASNNPMIIDGDKRAVAIYNDAINRKLNSSIHIPVYLILPI